MFPFSVAVDAASQIWADREPDIVSSGLAIITNHQVNKVLPCRARLHVHHHIRLGLLQLELSHLRTRAFRLIYLYSRIIQGPEGHQESKYCS